MKMSEMQILKTIELNLLSELMKNSRRSDRDLAKVLNVSQPTITRARKRLEKEGYIQEYTMIPNFKKVGYEIVSITFGRLKEGLSQEERAQAKKLARKLEKESAFESIVVARGIGCEADLVIVSLHENYSAYTRFMRTLKDFPIADTAEFKSFMISLAQDQYRPLTFRTLSKHLLTLEKEK
jgi:DNA-binding Lrp family transcriptional regulator